MKNRFTSLSIAALLLIALACHQEDGLYPQDQFLGTYNVAGTQRILTGSGKVSSINDVSDQVTISSIPNSNRIRISSVNHWAIEAVLINKNSFTVPDQLIPAQTASGYRYYKHYEGTGAVTNNTLLLSLNFSATTDQASTSNYTLTHVEGARQ